MARLSIHLSDPATGQGVFLPWHRATDATMTTNANGCEQLHVAMPLRSTRALPLLTSGMGLDMAVYAGGAAIWRGRLEEPGITLDTDAAALSLTAYGYQMAFDDLPYSALWSDSSYDGWQIVNGDQSAGRAPGKFTIDADNRLYIAPRKGEQFGAPTYLTGALSTATPPGGTRTIQTFSADYTLLLPTGWQARVWTYNRDWTGKAVVWSLGATGSLQTGTLSLTGLNVDRLEFGIADFNATLRTYTGETDANYARLINIRVKTTSASTVTPDAIAADMLSTVRTANPTQLSSLTTAIQAQGIDLKDETYLDANMRSVLNRLAGYGDAAGNRWQWRVWADQVLRLEPVGTNARTYTARLAQYDASRVQKDSYSQVYAAYTDSTNVRQVTSTSSISPAPRIARRLALQAQGKDATLATQERDAALKDMAQPMPAVRMTISALYDSRGARVPPYLLRSGDVVQAADVAPSILAANVVDRLRTFRVLSTQCNLLTGELGVDLETPNAQLAYLLARREEGL